MAKYDIYGDGTVIEVSHRDFFILLTQFTEACFDLAQSYVVNHVSGLADFDHDEFKSNTERIQRQYKVAFNEVEE